MLMRLTAAVLNGTLVLVLYVSAWGVHTYPMALLMVGLAVAAALATYALNCVGRPKWITGLWARRQLTRPDGHGAGQW
jgi:hypothetical protein